jgi:hypothetical protein
MLVSLIATGGDQMKGRRLLALAVPLVAVAAGAASFAYFVPDYSQRVAATANVAPSKNAYTLRAGHELDARALDGMTGALKTSGLRAVLNERSNLKGRFGGACGRAAGVPSGAKVFCFNASDSRNAEWYPQGITGVSDARADEEWDKERPLLVSWHDEDQNGTDKNARVTFVNTRTGTYRHVLLVLPYRNTQGRTTYEPVGTRATDTGIHAGGLAWYGNRLYVADTGSGLRVFDMRRIFDLGRSRNGSTERGDLVGLHGDTYHAYGYRYVMPQVLSYVPVKQSGESCTAQGTPNHSWLSVNRSGQGSLVAGEWCKNDRGRVAQYPLRDAETGSGAGADVGSFAGPGDLVTDVRGYAVPSSVVRLPASYVQGGATANGTWWFTRNVPRAEKPYPPGQKENPGELLKTGWSNGFSRVQRTTISFGPEDLSCWRGQNRMWTIAEHPGRRALYGIPEPRC